MELSSIRRCFVAHRESNANTNSPTLYSNLHFNQRTRMGCDISRTKEEAHRGVSIHAPTWGATSNCVKSKRFRDGFNPRTRTGCDHQRPTGTLSLSGFNPRTRTGCDHNRRSIGRRHKVSIHAPARGATNTTFFPKFSDSLFQSTHPHGVRLRAM